MGIPMGMEVLGDRTDGLNLPTAGIPHGVVQVPLAQIGDLLVVVGNKIPEEAHGVLVETLVQVVGVKIHRPRMDGTCSIIIFDTFLLYFCIIIH